MILSIATLYQSHIVQVITETESLTFEAKGDDVPPVTLQATADILNFQDKPVYTSITLFLIRGMNE